MDEGLPSVSIIAFFVILLIDIFVHGFNVALIHANKEEIEKKSNEKKDKTSLGILKLFDNDLPHRESMQILTVIVNMVLGGIVTFGISNMFASLLGITGMRGLEALCLVLSGLILALLIMSFGILIPTHLSSRNPEKWLFACYYPVTVLRVILYPVALVADILSKAVLYIFGVRDYGRNLDVTEEDIKSMVSEGQEQGVIQESEADMISNIFEFSDKEAQDIMTNRNTMMAIDANMSLNDAVSFMLDTNNSRFPVYLDDIDHIIGIMHIRDAMKKLSDETDNELPIRKIKGLLRQPKFVPETRNIDSLFHSMQSSKTQMVIVIDEYGQTAGLLTMEDILEEIVGNILDEYDEDESFVKSTRNIDEYEVDGKAPLEVLEKKFNIDFGETEFETINGYFISRLERIPEPDEEFDITIDGYNFKIQSVQNHMISSILLTKLPEDFEPEDKDLDIAKQ